MHSQFTPESPINATCTVNGYVNKVKYAIKNEWLRLLHVSINDYVTLH